MHMHVSACMHACVCAYVCVCVYACVCVCMCVYVCACVCDAYTVYIYYLSMQLLLFLKLAHICFQLKNAIT